LSPSNAVTFTTDAYTTPDFITAVPLDTTGDPCKTYKLSGHLANVCLLGAFFLFL